MGISVRLIAVRYLATTCARAVVSPVAVSLHMKRQTKANQDAKERCNGGTWVKRGTYMRRTSSSGRCNATAIAALSSNTEPTSVSMITGVGELTTAPINSTTMLIISGTRLAMATVACLTLEHPTQNEVSRCQEHRVRALRGPLLQHATLAKNNKKCTDCGDRTRDHEIKSLALYQTELSRRVCTR